jgi:myo-inositol-1(or 4)-monophosphatase
MIDLKEALTEAQSWARQAGKIQLEKWHSQNLKIETKSSVVDLVTEADKLSESCIIANIREKYPEHRILSEEVGAQQSESDFLWIIDPLDGTTNYAQGLPIFAVSIALKYMEETLLGVIYVPTLDQMYYGSRGKGSYLNGDKIQVNKKCKLEQCVLATGFPYDKAEHEDNNAKQFAHFIPRVRGMRRMGSAAYDLACVAAGFMDGYWEFNLSIWDVAAGVLLVQEAGGEIIYLKERRGVLLLPETTQFAC